MRQNTGVDCTSYHQSWSGKGGGWGKRHLRGKSQCGNRWRKTKLQIQRRRIVWILRPRILWAVCLCQHSSSRGGGFPHHSVHNVSLPLPRPNLRVPNCHLGLFSSLCPKAGGGKGPWVRRRKSVKNRTAQINMTSENNFISMRAGVFFWFMNVSKPLEQCLTYRLLLINIC